MRRITAAVTALWVALSGAAMADNTPVVVELYTSQGCSSCPPADALLHELGAQDDILPLAFHVDYWDYIGWADTFALPGNAKRQKGYVKAAGARTVYTPQMIIQGRDHVIGTRPQEVVGKISQHMGRPSPVDIVAERKGDRVAIALAPVAKLDGRLIVLLVAFDPSREVSIRRGENAGRKITYSNVVTAVEPLARWDGADPIEVSADLAADAEGAVLVQSEGHGPIVAALRLD
ncbi:MAG: DUF1223 domain-containing protein [Shimia sp.]